MRRDRCNDAESGARRYAVAPELLKWLTTAMRPAGNFFWRLLRHGPVGLGRSGVVYVAIGTVLKNCLWPL